MAFLLGRSIQVSIESIPFFNYNPAHRCPIRVNREYVHKKTKNKVGYIHIPDMGPKGFAEFHRYFLAEIVYAELFLSVK